MSQPPFALLFDLDGTLINTIDLLVSCMEYALNGRDRVPSRDEWIAGLGIPLRTQLRDWGIPEPEIETIVGRYREYQDGRLEAMTACYPGAAETVRWAREEGVRTGIVTSKGRGMTQRSLQHVGLWDAFDVIVTADDTTSHKPNPEPVWHALQALEIPVERALFVGDSTHDIRAGNSAGTFTGAARWGPFPYEALLAAGPSHWLESFADLPPVVQQLRAG
jgi:pyrophosphatase PpaX